MRAAAQWPGSNDVGARAVGVAVRLPIIALSLVAGCELPAKQQRPRDDEIRAPVLVHDPAPALQILDVTVREYGSNEPLYGVTVELAQDPPCMHGPEPHCGPPPGRFATTDDTGLAHFELPFAEEWRVTRIAEPGYLTQCPGLQDDNWHHRLVIKHHDSTRADYTCLLVPPSALHVRDRAAAIRIARANADQAAWLHEYRDAKVTDVRRHGLRWEVWFSARAERIPGDLAAAEPDEARDVVVDGLDGSSYVDIVIPPYSDYLPMAYGDPAFSN